MRSGEGQAVPVPTFEANIEDLCKTIVLHSLAVVKK